MGRCLRRGGLWPRLNAAEVVEAKRGRISSELRSLLGGGGGRHVFLFGDGRLKGTFWGTRSLLKVAGAWWETPPGCGAQKGTNRLSAFCFGPLAGFRRSRLQLGWLAHSAFPRGQSSPWVFFLQLSPRTRRLPIPGARPMTAFMLHGLLGSEEPQLARARAKRRRQDSPADPRTDALFVWAKGFGAVGCPA